MSVIVLSPRTGDTVMSPVGVRYSCLVTAPVTVTCAVGPTSGPPQAVQPPGGPFTSPPITAAAGQHTVKATASNGEVSSQSGVIVSTGMPPPVIIYTPGGGGGVPVMARRGGAFERFLLWLIGLLYALLGYRKQVVTGAVEPTLNPAAVVLAAFRLDPNTGQFTAEAVALAAPVAANGGWSGTLLLRYKAGDVFVVRAEAFDTAANPIGMATEVLTF